ncbi:MAG: hypothetical protein PHO52_01975 [Sulfuricurvum sp.]|uniref:hypothetical protein n=1 Tax=Sulfuricurvum sp. TaxID=2025608 RepID=UPI002623D3A4|nr:hypothetical protein [Sulfuricurvum sp.]MDD2782963.1 hypothetical protein [Sulfuricurvum sp.]
MSSLSSNLAELFGKLDLLAHISSLEQFFSREQNIAIPGDQERHFRLSKPSMRWNLKLHRKVYRLKPSSTI